jgi:hypothetical protein
MESVIEKASSTVTILAFLNTCNVSAINVEQLAMKMNITASMLWVDEGVARPNNNGDV